MKSKPKLFSKVSSESDEDDDDDQNLTDEEKGETSSNRDARNLYTLTHTHTHTHRAQEGVQVAQEAALQRIPGSPAGQTAAAARRGGRGRDWWD